MRTAPTTSASPVAQLLTWAGHHHGVFSAHDARALGVGSHRLRSMCSRGEVRRVHRGVYIVASVRWDHAPRIRAAVVAAGHGAVASHSSVAWLLGVGGVAHGRPEVTVTTDRQPLVPGVRVHRSRHLSDKDICTLNGVTTTTPSRTTIDLAQRLDAAERLHLVDQMLWNGHCTREDLHGRAVALQAGRRGVSTIVAATAPGAEPNFRSRLERDFGLLVEQAGLPAPLVNAPIVCDGRHYIADNLWPGPMLIVELIGLRFHDGPDPITRDAERANDLTTRGYRILSFTWQHVHGQADMVVRSIRQALRGG